LLSHEKIIKNCSNRFQNGDIRPEKTAGMEVIQVRRGKLLLLLLLLFLAEKKGEIKYFLMILAKKLLSDEFLFHNCSNRFRDGDFPQK
jgi:hypothetical protein